jgi:hypothetical protein
MTLLKLLSRFCVFHFYLFVVTANTPSSSQPFECNRACLVGKLNSLSVLQLHKLSWLVGEHNQHVQTSLFVETMEKHADPFDGLVPKWEEDTAAQLTAGVQSAKGKGFPDMMQGIVGKFGLSDQASKSLNLQENDLASHTLSKFEPILAGGDAESLTKPLMQRSLDEYYPYMGYEEETAQCKKLADSYFAHCAGDTTAALPHMADVRSRMLSFMKVREGLRRNKHRKTMTGQPIPSDPGLRRTLAYANALVRL